MPGFEPGQVVKAYDWSSLGEAVVVDVGGSSGAIALEIVKAFPSIRAVVQDLPEVISNAQVIARLRWWAKAYPLVRDEVVGPVGDMLEKLDFDLEIVDRVLVVEALYPRR